MPCPDALSGLHVLFLKVPPVMAPAPPNTPGVCSEDMPPAQLQASVLHQAQARQHAAPGEVMAILGSLSQEADSAPRMGQGAPEGGLEDGGPGAGAGLGSVPGGVARGPMRVSVDREETAAMGWERAGCPGLRSPCHHTLRQGVQALAIL